MWIREKAKIKKQHSTFLDALVNYTPKKTVDGLSAKPSPKVVAPGYPLRPVRVTPLQELPEMFTFKHEVLLSYSVFIIVVVYTRGAWK